MATEIITADLRPPRTIRPKEWEIQLHRWEHRQSHRLKRPVASDERNRYMEWLFNHCSKPNSERDFDCEVAGCDFGVIHLKPPAFTVTDEGERRVYRQVSEPVMLIVWTQPQCMVRLQEAETAEGLLVETESWALAQPDEMHRQWARDCVAILKVTHQLAKRHSVSLDDIFLRA